MFERFEQHFNSDQLIVDENRDFSQVGFDSSLHQLFQRHAGQTFNNNIYRIMSFDQGLRIGQTISTCFDGYDEKMFCFGCDWMGRIFASNGHTPIDDHPSVIMFHPAYGELFTVNFNVVGFHNEALVDLTEDVLAENFYSDWLSSGGHQPSPTQCAGHRVPLFLNGSGDVSNLEVTDLELYWDITAQLIVQTRDLPDGTEISSIELK